MKPFVAVALLALIIGLGIASFQPLSSSSTSCGSWVLRDRSGAERADSVDAMTDDLLGQRTLNIGSHARACDKAYSDRTPIVIGLGFLVLIAGVGLVVAPGSLRPPKPA